MRCCWPPDSSCGARRAACREADQLEHLARRARSRCGARQVAQAEGRRCRPRSGAGTARSPGTPCRCGAASGAHVHAGGGVAQRLAADRRCGRRPARSSPATARSSEVLPQPDGPISTPICPARQRQRHAVDRGAAAPRRVAHARPARAAGTSAYDSGCIEMRIVRIRRSMPRAGCRAPAADRCCCLLLALPVLGVLGSWLRCDAAALAVLRTRRRPCCPATRAQSLLLALGVGVGVGAARRRDGGRGDAVRLSRPPRLRVGAAAAAGDAGLRAGLRLHRLRCSTAARCRPRCAQAFGAAGRAVARRAQPAGARCCCSCCASTPTSIC